MLFIKTDKLKPGMRIARPIYNRQGVLLYDRAAVIRDTQSIENIKGFGLIGLFILEPAEPVPPMTEQDIEFERFQTMMTFQIRDELNVISRVHRTSNFSNITANIIKSYGSMDTKLTFTQSLRSKEDFLFKHSLNVAILCAVIAHRLKLTATEQNEVVMAAIVHDIGRLDVPPEIIAKRNHNQEERDMIAHKEVEGYKIIDDALIAYPNVRKICSQSQVVLKQYKDNGFGDSNKMSMAAKILTVAGNFDLETAVQLDVPPNSEVTVIKRMLQRDDVFDKKVIEALISSLNILVPGVSVELNNGEKALVINENLTDFLHPMVLLFKNNKLVDLTDKKNNGSLEIVDIMKTMDNRCVIRDVSGFGGNQPNDINEIKTADTMSDGAGAILTSNEVVLKPAVQDDQTEEINGSIDEISLDEISLDGFDIGDDTSEDTESDDNGNGNDEISLDDLGLM